MYPLVFFDALRVKIRDEGAACNKAVHIALGVRLDGAKAVPGLWLEQKLEGSENSPDPRRAGARSGARSGAQDQPRRHPDLVGLGRDPAFAANLFLTGFTILPGVDGMIEAAIFDVTSGG